MPTFSRFGIFMRLRRPHEPSSRPPGRPSPCEVEGGEHGSGRRKRKGPPRIEKRVAKRGERSDFHSVDHRHLGILHIFIPGATTRMHSFSFVLSLVSFAHACGVQVVFLGHGALGICKSSVRTKNRGPLCPLRSHYVRFVFLQNCDKYVCERA